MCHPTYEVPWNPGLKLFVEQFAKNILQIQKVEKYFEKIFFTDIFNLSNRSFPNQKGICYEKNKYSKVKKTLSAKQAEKVINSSRCTDYNNKLLMHLNLPTM